MPQPQGAVKEEPLQSPEAVQQYWDELEKQDNAAPGSPAAAASDDEPALAGDAATKDEPSKETQAADAATPPRDDPWAGVPKVVRETLTDISGKLKTLGPDRLDRIEGALQATVGRVGSIQSQLAKQAEMHKAATAAAQASTSTAPSQAQITAAVKDPEKWTRLKADFPEWADGVAEYLEARLAANQGARYDDSEVRKGLEESGGKLSTLEKSVSTLLQRDEQLREMVVEMRHPGWTKTVTTPAFRQWRDSQPQEVRALGRSESPLDAVRMLDLFEEHRKKAPNPEEIARERKDRLASSASVKGSRGVAPTKSVDDMSPEEYWKHLDELDARRRPDDD